MDLNLKGKKALVTGASTGLGAAAAMALASEGVELYINARTENTLNKTARDIQIKTGIEPMTIPADLTDEKGIDLIRSKIDKVDILVSNAGGPPPGQFTEHDRQKWQDAEKLVLSTAINLTRLVIDDMIKQKYGRLIYITSIGVLQPVDDLILSNTYRAAVTGMCKTISNNYAKHGITANCVCPGFTATERLTDLAKARAEASGLTVDEIFKSFRSQIPADRIGQPEELAALITFLASDKAGYITGTSIPVDGGHIKSLI